VRTVRLRILPALALLLLGSLPAVAQSSHPQAQASGGGVPSGGGIRHITATGLGMAVGRSANGNIVSYEGFLARYVAARDTVAPVFDPPLADQRVVIPANAATCEATVNIQLPRAVDNRDPNPTVVLFRVIAGQQQPLNPGNVTLGRGSHDIVARATDRRGNVTTGSYRINVVDTTAPVFVSTPNPTPAGMEAEATSPAGTPVNFAAPVCNDVCGAPAITSNAPARYPLGNTDVAFTCTDASGNQSVANTTIRVRDRTRPSVQGGPPADFAVECNNPVGSSVQVPGVAWTDNGYNANQLTLSLVVDPAGANVVHSPVPPTVTLTGGPHVLRYIAQDPAGNRAEFDLDVVVSDNSAPRIEVVNAPALGWYNQNAQVNLRITDNCSALGNALQVNVQPPAAAQAINGGVLTLEYRADGIYALTVTVTDGANNAVVDNSVGFGIDRTAPSLSIVIPSQQGVVANQNYTYPLYALAETMPLNVTGEDPGDGQVSGVRRVQVILDPQGGAPRTLVDRTFAGNGSPQRGARSQPNIRCGDNIAGDVAAKCNAAGEVIMRRIAVGPHVLRTIVTDFAGNTTQTDARVLNANLRDGLDVVGTRIQARLAAQPALPVAVVNRLNRAVLRLNEGRLMAGPVMAGSAYGTPIFLGGALKSVEAATIQLELAMAEAALPAGELPALRGHAETLLRVGHSDLSLFRETIDEAGILDEILADPDLAPWLPAEYATDISDGDDYLVAMEAATVAQRYSQAAANGTLSFFSLKSAWSGWMMDYTFVPANFFPAGEFSRGANILAELEEELTTYLTIQNPPAQAKAIDMQQRLNAVASDLARLAQFGFDNEQGLSDEEYLLDMLELQNIANSSNEANALGMWVRNYQWAMMQVVRLMAQSSTSVARLGQGAASANWAIIREAQRRIDEGRDYLAGRDVQEVINLYGEEGSTCSMIAVYHCHFTTDEGADDIDADYTAQLSDACWYNRPGGNDLAIHPDDWAAQPAGLVPARCRWDTDI
jgi:hypothetical protein